MQITIDTVDRFPWHESECRHRPRIFSKYQNSSVLTRLRRPHLNLLAIAHRSQQIASKSARKKWSTGMKAVGYRKSLPVDAADSLIDFATAKPEPKGRDLLVAVKAISVNPVDYKVRKRAAPPEGETKILGYDAAGIVDAVGPDVTLFKPGDEVFYAGSILRQGTNSEFHLVDERIVGAKPKTLSFAQAAALPLTSITAWELLFDRLGAVPGKSLDPRTLLIVGGAGGVGSILIQLARRLTGLTIVATASRPESQKWCLDLGAHAVIDHLKPMKEQIEKLKVSPVGLIASLTNTEQHYKALADVIAPQGKYGLIDDPQEFNVSVFKGKAVSVHWESMFTRSSFQTPDMIDQHNLLNDVADLIDKGVLRTTLDQSFGTINAANLKRAHALLESGKSRGKIVLEGW
jgi:zinc-binding alcohol dehydrogenase family protein